MSSSAVPNPDDGAVPPPSLPSASPVDSAEPAVLSKNAKKRLLREERWSSNASERREKRKQKKAEQKVRRRALLEQGLIQPQRKKMRKSDIVNHNITVVIDCDFEDLMPLNKDFKSLARQIERCYSANRRSEHHLKLVVTSLGDRLTRTLEQKVPRYKQWDFQSTDYFSHYSAQKEKLVYLTADTPDEIQTLEDDHIYVIGGIVDKNRYKGLTYRRALEKGVKVAQLPIGQHMKLTQRKVLTVNHVFEILSRFIETNDWKTAFTDVIPKRKLKSNDSSAQSGDGDEDGEEDEDEDEESDEHHDSEVEAHEEENTKR
ncbi:hypothetical protein M427DRAFT_95702 [Gonapodya prolifera JEL478]|uniref:tRNA (guanine(9)-N1)-methyltransferase n=1 Tax=Gonapodya prolifera (strain JEL478) TaxID=1344416 RepID=A0A139AQT8_GONPJ|nr:hypothetical protein M427DRAFT_95702 [Gonapodya prolifera JEL478]|eukprot:KXS18873.1 hypothetical protein M427DRAFT_95702 [Gonapodya prolifera JEL478]